ncbi:hypothetical protein HZB60_00565 [candidate division KSB1 bacterium]|nr:hypothetical protein [candidate division KSB1 bacterium]
MRTFLVISLAALVFVGWGCSNQQEDNPSTGGLSYDVIGEDSPESVDAALQELASLSILVPDPVSADDPILTQTPTSESASSIVDRARLDDEGRVNFRRIVAHLQAQQRALRECMARNDNPRLLRLAHGAQQAYNHGLRALEAGEPRMALRYFEAANRILNLALRLCRAGG